MPVVSTFNRPVIQQLLEEFAAGKHLFIDTKYCIYKVTNNINGKSYVGQTKNLFERLNDHIYSEYHGALLLHRAIQKYGVENFTVTIVVQTDDKSELDNFEIDCIKKFVALSPLGYNLTEGGSRPPSYKGKKHSSETLTRLSELNSGENNGFYGKIHTAETKKLMRERKLGTINGEQNPFYGKQHSLEVKEFISKTNKGRKHSPEALLKIQEASKKMWEKRRREKECLR